MSKPFASSSRAGGVAWAPRLRQVALACASLGVGLGLGLAALPVGAQSAGGNGSSGVDDASGVRAPYYGEVLFQFFQDRYFSAITELMAAQTQNRLGPHGAEAELLRGGMLLSYGMHRDAGEVFERLLASNPDAGLRDKAWFHLARIRYQRGLYREAAAALDHIQAPLPGAQDDERGLLVANVQLALNDRALDATLAALAQRPDPAWFARYNQGVVQARRGQVAGASLLEALGRTPAATEEQRALRDQANLSLAFAALREGQPESARALLERVRQQGPAANRALLAAGWTAVALGQPAQALAPWGELVRRDPADPAVLEAKVAWPFALAESGARAQALAAYQQALSGFEAEQQALEQAISTLQIGALEDELAQMNPGDELGWMRSVSGLPSLARVGQLTGLLAEHRFQEGIKNHLDLLFLQRHLRDWQQRIGGHGEMLAHRREAFGQRLPQFESRTQGLSLGALTERRGQLAGELAQAAERADGAAFAQPAQQGLLNRLARVQATLAKPGVVPEPQPEPQPETQAAPLAQTGAAAEAIPTAAERARLLKGLLAWDLAEQQPARQWEAQKALNAADAELATAAQRLARLQSARAEQQAQFDALAERVRALELRIRELLPQLAALDADQRRELHAMAEAALRLQQQRLKAYSSQARLGVAQLYDHASLAVDGETLPAFGDEAERSERSERSGGADQPVSPGDKVAAAPAPSSAAARPGGRAPVASAASSGAKATPSATPTWAGVRMGLKMGSWSCRLGLTDEQDCAAPLPGDNAPTLKAMMDAQPQRPEPGAVRADLDEAVAAYERFLETQPRPALRAQALRRLGDLDLARADQRLAQRSDTQPEQELRGAIARYRQVLAEFPDEPGNDGVLYQLAHALDVSGDSAGALNTLDTLVQAFPTSRYRDEAHFRRGELLFAKRRYAPAELAYAAVLAGAPDNPFRERSLYMRGWSLFKLGRLDDALPPFFQVLDLKLAGTPDETPLDELPGLTRGDRELVDDSFRVISLALAGLKGADTLPELVDSEARRSYELRAYLNLAALYQRQERVKDMADTLSAFARRHPVHNQAPVLDAQVIALHEAAGFETLAMQGREEFVTLYRPGANFQSANPPAWERTLPQVRQYLDVLTQEHHARAQRSRSSADYQTAARWYRAWLEVFPLDERAPAQRFLLAELLFEDQRWAEALAEYEATAYAEPPHVNSANAGYAALLAHQKLVAAAGPLGSPAGDEARRAAVISERHFVQAFPTDARRAMVLTDAADTLHRLGDAGPAREVAEQVLALNPPAEPAQRRVAWLIVAHHSFGTQDYARTEQALVEVLALTPAKDPGRAELVERQAAAIYKQAEQARSAGQDATAAGHFARAIQTASPASEVAVAARLDLGITQMALKDWPAAARSLEDFRQRYPRHPAQPDVTARLALVYTEQQRWALAATEYERLADAARDPLLARAARWQVAEMNAKAAESSPAARPGAMRAWQRYLQMHPAPLEPAVEARDRLAQLAQAMGDTKRATAWTREVFDADQRGGDARTPRTRALGAAAALTLAQPLYQDFRKIALLEPLAKTLKAKKTKMEEVLRAYQVAVEAGAPEVASEAAFQMAAVYQDFGQALLASQRPKKLSALELEQYNVLLEEQAFPFEEKATELHEANARRTLSGRWDAWVQRSLEALRKLRPVRWGKTERSQGSFDAMD